MRQDQAYFVVKQPKSVMVDMMDDMFLRQKQRLREYELAVQKQIFLGTPLPDRFRGLGRPG